MYRRVPSDSRFPGVVGPLTEAEGNQWREDMENWANGFTPSGVFVSQNDYIISMATDGGVDYFCASNAYQPVYGGFTTANHHIGGVDGASLGAVLQAALTNVTNGGTVYLKGVVGDATDLVISNSKTSLIGDGVSELRIPVGRVTPTAQLSVAADVTDVVVKGIRFYGRREINFDGLWSEVDVPANPQVAFMLLGSNLNITVENCAFLNQLYEAIWVPYYVTIAAHKTLNFNNNYIYDCGYGITIEKADNVLINNNFLYGCKTWGISLNYNVINNVIIAHNLIDGTSTYYAGSATAGIQSGGSTTTTNVSADDNTIASCAYALNIAASKIVNNSINLAGYAIQVSAESTLVSGNSIKNTGSNAINILAGQNHKIVNNTIDDCCLDQVEADTYGAINTSPGAGVGDYSLIAGNILKQTTDGVARYGIWTATNSIVTDNTVLGNFLIPMLLDASATVHHNVGYVTESKGVSVGTGAPQTIAHGLVGLPIRISIVPIATGITPSNVYADATNIYCTVTNGADYNWSAQV
jgi:hypothetical protein